MFGDAGVHEKGPKPPKDKDLLDRLLELAKSESSTPDIS
jgi:hypothetical protein